MSAPYEEVPSTHRRCGVCKRVFAGRKDLNQHFVMKHGRDPRVEDFLPVARPDREESFADRSIEAEQDRAMGIYNPDQDWLI